MEIIFSIVGKIGEYSVGPIGEQFGYIISYKSNIATLREKIPKLFEKKEAVQQSVDGAQWNQKVVASEVKTWLIDVEKKIEEVEKFLEEDVKANTKCLNGWCPNLKLHYSLGKKAQKNTQAIDELLKEGENYDRVYTIKPPLEVRSSSIDQRFEDFESRKLTIRDVLEALKNDKIDMIALCGMGGIGKTAMAKEIERRVKAESLFNKVAIAVVSQKPDLIKVQDEIAEQLGPKLDEKTLVGRARQINSRLMDSKSVLVILDDVWEPLDLGDIGVIEAVKQKSCKILLTSRNEETCNGMRIQKIFPVGLLSEKEAWKLFIAITGDWINAFDLISIAKQVAKECARLPLAIAIVGGALRNKSDKKEWKAALKQLKMSIPDNICGLHPKVYSRIEFSYNYLESDEAKSCFLLCCLYPEDYDIPVEDLVRYGVAKRFLKGLGTLEETREHIHTIVKNLIRSNLLLDCFPFECVKMHDVVRDVAISIASRDENGFMVVLDKGLEEWPQKDRSDSCTAISLLLGEMKVHRTELKCPKLELLQLSCLNDSETLPDNLFNGMKELKMLSLQTTDCFSLLTLPPSIQILQNLQMLKLEDCHLVNVSAIGTLGNLEILGFHNLQIEELPSEIGNLSRLKLLDITKCYSLKRIPAGVLSGLSRLEELYMRDFKNWGCTTTMEGNGEVTNNNASLAELIPYSSQLVVLEISVPSILCLPKELDFRNSNFRFKIDIDGHRWTPNRYLFENTLTLEVEDASDLGEHRTILSLLKNVVVLNLDIAKNFKHIWFEKEEKRILPCSLKHLTINRCEDLEYLIEATSDSTAPNTFHLLESLALTNLPRFIGIYKSTNSVEVEGGGSIASTIVTHKLFSSNPILWVPNLKSLKVDGCESIEVVFDLEGIKVKENRKPILKELRNLNLQNLSGMSHVWKNIPQGFQGFQNLTFIFTKECHSLRNLFPTSIAKLLVQLQYVGVKDCNLMENIIQREYEAGEERIADILSSETHSLKWPSIKSINLWGCLKLKTFGSKVQSGRKQKKMDAKLRPKAQEPSAGSSSARESSGLFNRCLESCVPRPRNYSPALQTQGKSNSSLGLNKHDLINKEITLTKQEEQNVSETENQAKMLSLFPYNLIESLENLQELSIHQCDSLEVIFELEGLNAEESNIFNNLTKLSLKVLPKLLHIWKKLGPRDIEGFNYLRLLKVWECGSLKCLFTPSIAKLLVKVEEIEVYGCNEMEEILAKELGDEENRDVIAFPLVKTLKLGNLQKLECFYSEDNHAFEWSSLDKITIVGCPELKMFVSTSTKTPKLKGVHTKSGTFEPMVEGDLNATIQHIIKGKGLNQISSPPFPLYGDYRAEVAEVPSLRIHDEHRPSSQSID